MLLLCDYSRLRILIERQITIKITNQNAALLPKLQSLTAHTRAYLHNVEIYLANSGCHYLRGSTNASTSQSPKSELIHTANTTQHYCSIINRSSLNSLSRSDPVLCSTSYGLHLLFKITYQYGCKPAHILNSHIHNVQIKTCLFIFNSNSRISW